MPPPTPYKIHHEGEPADPLLTGSSSQGNLHTEELTTAYKYPFYQRVFKTVNSSPPSTSSLIFYAPPPKIDPALERSMHTTVAIKRVSITEILFLEGTAKGS